MNLHTECTKLYEKKLKEKTIFHGVSTDIFDALKVLYNNINFQEINDNATKKNNFLIFKDNEIVLTNYKYKRFKSTDENPCFNIQNITLFIKRNSYKRLGDNIYAPCLDIKLLIKLSKRSRACVRYKIAINVTNYRHIARFLTVCQLSEQYNSNNES